MLQTLPSRVSRRHVRFSEDFVASRDRSADYQVCARCVMDTSDPHIAFDEHSVCTHCTRAAKYLTMLEEFRRGPEGSLDHFVSKLETSTAPGGYDCVIGLSGGLDSSYVALLVSQLGLRPLAVHLDNGWNSELAVKNIENTVRRLDIDLYTHVIDWEEFRDLQLSFFQASVVDIEMLTDHAILAILFQEAKRHRIKHVVLGTNAATECILPKAWIHPKQDARHIRHIHRKWGKIRPKSFPWCGSLKLEWYRRAYGIERESLLNYIDYNKSHAQHQLQKHLDYVPYAGKHSESVFTRFYQNYILPKKFGIDKRRAHLSTLIASGQISRGVALEELNRPLYRADMLTEDYNFVLKKWGLSSQQFEAMMIAPPRPHGDFKSEAPMIRTLKRLNAFRRSLASRFLSSMLGKRST